MSRAYVFTPLRLLIGAAICYLLALGFRGVINPLFVVLFVFGALFELGFWKEILGRFFNGGKLTDRDS